MTTLGWKTAAVAFSFDGLRGVSLRCVTADAFDINASKAIIFGSRNALTRSYLAHPVTGKGRDAAKTPTEESRRASDTAAELGAAFDVTVVEGLMPDCCSPTWSRRVGRVVLPEILPHSRAAGIALAIEELHLVDAADWSMGFAMQDANDWADRLDAGISIAVDTCHVCKDPEAPAPSALAAAADSHAACHISGWPVETRSLPLDARIPGEGVIETAAFLQATTAVNITGLTDVRISLEPPRGADPDADFAQIIDGCTRHVCP